MRALVVEDGGLHVDERPTPEPVGDQVLVEVAGAGLNRADLIQRAGRYPAPPGWPQDVPGLEFSGTVVALGAGVTELTPGDRVFGIAGGGAQASHLVAPEALCARVPEGLDLVHAGGVPEAFVTAHDALLTGAGLALGERVLIHGVGSGVGTAAVQLARAAGATSVGTARTRAKLDRAKALGLDSGVEAGRDMEARIGEVDVVLDLVGGDYLQLDVAVCRPKGRIVVVGLLAGTRTELDLRQIMQKRLTIRGTVLRSRPEHEKAGATAAFARSVVPLLASGAVEPVIDKVVGLESAPQAYDELRSNATFGKIVLAP